MSEMHKDQKLEVESQKIDLKLFDLLNGLVYSRANELVSKLIAVVTCIS